MTSARLPFVLLCAGTVAACTIAPEPTGPSLAALPGNGKAPAQFASDDATVVVGTVIDPELSNQVRVTVVATGLGRPAAATRIPHSPVRERESVPARERDTRGEVGMRVVRRTALSSSDYAPFDKPTIQRQRAVGDGLRAEADPEELLDVPAFLRRQAD